MSIDDLRRLWSEITPLFSIGAALTIPALCRVRILKQVAPIAIGLLESLRIQTGVKYRGFAYTLSLVAAELPNDYYVASWDQLSVNPHEASEASRLSVNELPPAFKTRRSRKTAAAPASPSKGKQKGKKAVSVLVKKPPIVTKTRVPKTIIAFEDDDNDYESESEEETVVVVNPSASPAKLDSPSKRLKPRPGHHSASAVLPLDESSSINKDIPSPRTRGEKRKRDTEIVAAETQAETSNIRNKDSEPPKKMTRQRKAQIGHQAAARVPPHDISFDPVTMRPVDAEEVHWLSTATMDPKVACSLCNVGSQKKPCEFLGWGVACGNCQCGKKVVCSFKADPYERYRARISILSFAERTPERLCQLLGNADLLVKVFDSACETAGRLSELLCENCESIDAMVHDTVEFKGCAIAEEALLTDVSTINGLMDKFTTQEVDSASVAECSEPSNQSLWRLVYDDPRFTQERSPRSPVFNDTGDLDLEYPRLDEELAGEADADGELDPDVKV
ncbi:hypothetical protein EDD85DRAFT_960039 [Armillaria nabsnona]|nr:hypothetical protein EDD85DRAFT_960039 [Armillaria nabsnona]